MRIEIKDKKNFIDVFNNLYPNNKLNDINGISIDSRKVLKNDIFFPIKGEKFDGHDFINDIQDKTVTIFSEKKLKKNIIYCKSTKKEIINISKSWRKKTRSKIIAITGSNGKTTLKEILFNVIKKKYLCSKSEGNYNSTIGLPLTFLSSLANDEICILELGANKPNEIKFLSKIFNPDYAIITNISKAHLGNFNSFKDYIKTKNDIFEYVNKKGEIFINADDKNINSVKNKSTTKFSFNKAGDINAYLNGNIMKIKFKNKTAKINIPDEMLHLKNNILASYAISKKLNISNIDFQNAISTFKIPNGRGQTIKYKNFKLIDDAYNANPASMFLGIERFDFLKTKGRKILVIGDMLELGKHEIIEHEKLGKFINEKKIDIILTYGNLIKFTYQEIDNIKFEKYHFNNFRSLYDKFHSITKKNDFVYIKSSRSKRLERLYN